MRRIASAFISVSILLGSLGPGASRAFAQAVAMPQVPSNLSAPPVALAGAGIGAFSFDTRTSGIGANLGYNSAGFFVLGKLDAMTQGARPNAAASLASPSNGLAADLTSMLRSSTARLEPNSPRTLAARTLAHAILDPDGVSRLEPGLTSIHPEIGPSVATQLRRTAAQARGDASATPTVLRQLRSAVLDIDRLSAKAAVGNADLLRLNRLFVGRVQERGTDILRDTPSPKTLGLAAAVSAQAAYMSWEPAANPAARLLPSKPAAARRAEAAGPGQAIPVGDVARAVEYLDARSIKDPLFWAAVRQATQENPELSRALDSHPAFLIPHEPELLRLLRMSDQATSAVRTLSDGGQNLSILIVALPARGEITQLELRESLLREARALTAIELPYIFPLPAGETVRKVLHLSHGPWRQYAPGRTKVRGKGRFSPSLQPSPFQGEGVQRLSAPARWQARLGLHQIAVLASARLAGSVSLSNALRRLDARLEPLRAFLFGIFIQAPILAVAQADAAI